MDICIYPNLLNGSVRAIASKSQAHRLLICAAFSDAPTTIFCNETNQDIEATADCLRSLGAVIKRTNDSYEVTPCATIPEKAELNCRESGSTLRFLLPIVAALGVNATFLMSGRLHQRPLSPLWEVLEANGCVLTRPTETTLNCTGKLKNNLYVINGNVSSQFISGLLFALPLLSGKSQICVAGKLESKPYVTMTQNALNMFGVKTDTFSIEPQYPFRSPREVTVEGDWSNGAFFLAANAIGSNVCISNLNHDSAQGDKAVYDILNNIDHLQTIDAADIPDLVPILAVVAGTKNGVTFNNIARLRLKESDRVDSVIRMLNAFGIKAYATDNTLTVEAGKYRGCTVDAMGDHRIAMAAAIAATVADGPVRICGAECVSKSYPAFWEEYTRLGGKYEQYLR